MGEQDDLLDWLINKNELGCNVAVDEIKRLRKELAWLQDLVGSAIAIGNTIFDIDKELDLSHVPDHALIRTVLKLLKVRDNVAQELQVVRDALGICHAAMERYDIAAVKTHSEGDFSANPLFVAEREIALKALHFGSIAGA